MNKPAYVMAKKCTGLFFLIFSICFISCNSLKKKSSADGEIGIIQLPEPSAVSKEEANRIYTASEAWFDSVLQPTGFNGGMIVAKNGNIIFEKYKGTAHLPGKDTINENTSLHIASVSKTFTAMAILKLWQDGKINIDDEVKKYLPGFDYPGITVRSLLNHRSGLPNYVHYLDNCNWDKNKIATNEDIFQTLTNKQFTIPPATTPNSRFNYCNTNFALLALIAEKISGKKFGEFMKETFFIPLQMKNTFVFSMADSGKVAPSYDWRQRLMPFTDLDLVYGDKNVYTTPRDLLIWDRALTSGKIFKPETLEQAYAPYSNEKPGIRNYGLGWRMNIYPGGKKMIYHNGWWHGSNAAFIRLLKDSATIIIIGNKFNRGIYHAKDLANIFADYAGGNEDEEMENSKQNGDTAAFKDNSAIDNEQPLNYRDSLLNEALKSKPANNTPQKNKHQKKRRRR